MFIFPSFNSAYKHKSSFQVVVKVDNGYALMSHLHYCIYKQDMKLTDSEIAYYDSICNSAIRNNYDNGR